MPGTACVVMSSHGAAPDDLTHARRCGVYGSADAKPTEHHSLAVVAKRVLGGVVYLLVVCLLSALWFHGICMQGPAEVWLAIGPGGRLPLTCRHIMPDRAYGR